MPEGDVDVRIRLVGALLAVISIAFFAAARAADPDPRQSYRFTVRSSRGGPVEFRGVMTVDGKARLIERRKTPFEFRCEAGSVITGYFEVLTPGRAMDVRVYDPAHSKRRSAASYSDARRVRFSWSKPGGGPRCLDHGSGACPDTVPGVDDLQRLLQIELEKKAATESVASPANPPDGVDGQ